jgi:tRNA (guanine37-N1)-methyltransferase
VKITVITLFPEYFDGPSRAGILGRAVESGLIKLDCVDLREFGEGRHRMVDDTPYGGGAGMVMKAGPVVEAIETVRSADPEAWVVLLTPQGRRFEQPVAKELSLRSSVAFVCGRYEGFDERIRAHVDEELSLGDFVLMGGEAAALAMIEGATRLIPGVLGDIESTTEESMADGLLEYPHYTRPRDFRGQAVPEVLLGGNHAEITRWRREMALARTKERRPDLLRSKAKEDGEAK